MTGKKIVLIACCVTVVPMDCLLLAAVVHVGHDGSFDETVLGNLLKE
jgi:hypothetical protein